MTGIPEPELSDSSSVARDSADDAAPTPRSLLFTVLAGLWVFPSIGAIWILLGNPSPWRSGLGLAKRVQLVTLEQWLGLGLLLLHFAFVLLAIHYRRVEQGKTRQRSSSEPGRENT